MDFEATLKTDIRIYSFPETTEALWNKFYPRIMVSLSVFRTVSREDSEELASDTLLKAWQNRDSVRIDSDCRVWIFTIARRTALDTLRTQKNTSATLYSDFDNHKDASARIP